MSNCKKKCGKSCCHIKTEDVSKHVAVSPTVNVEIDYEKLAEAILKANDMQKKREIWEKGNATKEWQKSIGVRDYSDKKWPVRMIGAVVNYLSVAWNLVFFSRKKRVGTSVTTNFFRMISVTFFNLIKLAFWLVAIIVIAACFYHPVIEPEMSYYIFLGLIAFVAILFASLFRVMAIEIDQISDRERILGIFAAVMSLFPIAEKVIELVKEAFLWQG